MRHLKLASTTFGGGTSRLVFVHGFTQTANSWRAIAAQFVDSYQIVLPDLPGHGRSHDVVGDLVTTADLLAQVGQTATYIGYSLGGRVCLHLALQHPQFVERLILIGATAGLDGDLDRRARRKNDAQLAARVETIGVEAFVREWLSQPLFEHRPDDADDLADRLTNTAGGLAASLLHAGTGSQRPLWSELHQLTMPVHVYAGEYDHKFIEAGRRLAATIGANATFTVVGGAGHGAHSERPDTVRSSVHKNLSGS